MEFHNNKDSIYFRKKQKGETAKIKNFHLDFLPVRFRNKGNGRNGEFRKGGCSDSVFGVN